ncbi:patatin-like phospholipase family protein [Chloroflexota bacterium]
MKRTYPFKNLVFKGGGIKVFVYLGAIDVLEEVGILKQIKRVAGNSAGSIMATILSFRLSMHETSRIFSTLDYSKISAFEAQEFPDGKHQPPKTLVEKGAKVKGGMTALNRLRTRYGLFSSEVILNWLRETIASQCDGNDRATFADFKQRGFRDLHIVATNISKHKITEFSVNTTPQVQVANAAMASCSIPFFFEALQFDGERFGQGDFYADGGVLTNYPIHIFDEDEYSVGNPFYEHGVNWETLGLRLFTPEECLEELTPITNMPSYIRNLLATVASTEDASFEHTLVDRVRTINVSNCCVDTTDFTIKPGTEKYDEMLEAGRTATREFLEKYRAGTGKIAELKAKFSEFIDS